VRVISIDQAQFSFGRSLNLGCTESRGEFIVIVSAHVYPVCEDWLEQLLKPFSNPRVALSYGKQKGNETSNYSEHQVFAKWFPEQSNFNQNHPFCNNANAAIRRSLWQQIGYDELLTGLEDLHWATKMMSLGYQISYVAEAEIVHIHDETPQNIFNRYRREAISFKKIFPQQKFSIWNLVWLTTTNTIIDYYHAIRDGVIMANLLSVPMFRLMQFWGTYKGFHQHGSISKQLRETFYYPRKITKISKIEISSELKNERQPINYH
jgi:rhamnosyltransferase